MKNRLIVLTVIACSSVYLAGLAVAQVPETEPSPKADKKAEKATPDKKKEPAKKTDSKEKKESTAKAAGSTLSAQDKAFIKKAAKGGMMEVEWGKWASEKGQHADVKKFGARMVTDHTKANKALTALAAKKGVKAPAHKMSGKWKSDKDYMAMMVKDHEKTLAEFQKEAKEGSDPDLKKWAEKTSKVIQKHLDQAKKIQAKLT